MKPKSPTRSTAIVLVTILVVIVAAVVVSLSTPKDGSQPLVAGAALKSGESLNTSDGYQAVMQKDCNFVVNAPGVGEVWETDTDGLGRDCSMQVTSAGNVVVRARQAHGIRTVWQTGTVTADARPSLQLTSGGDLVLSARGNTLWSSIRGHQPPRPLLKAGEVLTSGMSLSNGTGTTVTMKANCDLAVSQHGTAGWDSGTDGLVAGCYLILLHNGNLVLKGLDKHRAYTIWETATSGPDPELVLNPAGVLTLTVGGKRVWTSSEGRLSNSSTLEQGQTLWSGEMLQTGNGYTAVMQTDCNLVVYNKSQTAVWQSGTIGYGPGCRLKLSGDGELGLDMVTHGGSLSQPRVLWQPRSRSAGTIPTGTGTRLTLTEHGVLRLTRDGRLLWSSAWHPPFEVSAFEF